MNAEEITITALNTDMELMSIIGSRIYPDIAQQDAVYPLIVYSRSGSEPTYTIDGTRVAERVTMSVAVWDKTRLAADENAELVRRAMNAQGCYHLQRIGGYDADVEAYATQFDFTVWED